MADSQKNNHIYEFGVQVLSQTRYSRYENKLLMQIYLHLQKDFNEAITQQSRNLPLSFTPAEESERMRHRKIPLRHLEPRKGHYQRAKDALRSMAQKPISIPYYDHNKRLTYASYPCLFKVEFMIEGKQSYVHLAVPIDMLRLYMSNAMGYHKLDLDEMFQFRQNATRQLYRLYHGLFARGYNRLDPRFVAVNLSSSKGNYSNYSALSYSLLAPAQKEMEEAYMAGTSKLRFNYQPIYAPDTTHGKFPEKISFNFITREDDHPTGERRILLDTSVARIRVTLKYGWGVNEKTVDNICERIKVSMIPEIDDLIEHKQWYVQKRIREGKALVNKAGYIVKALGMYLDAKEAEERMHSEKTLQKYPQGYTGKLF